jgi:hypothetical protein
VAEQRNCHVAEHRRAVRRSAIELSVTVTVTHDEFLCIFLGRRFTAWQAAN